MSTARARNWIDDEKRIMKKDAHYPVRIERAENDDWLISSFDIAKSDLVLTNLRYLRDGAPEMVLSPGHYTRLIRKPQGLDHVIVMSNTQFEYRTNKPFVDVAHGNVLVTGLGLGMIIDPLLQKEDVESITVVEISQSLIDLVSPAFANEKNVTIVQGDGYTWLPARGVKFDCAWHDIWEDASEEHIPEYAKIRAHYRSRIRGPQMCWAETIARRQKRRGW